VKKILAVVIIAGSLGSLHAQEHASPNYPHGPEAIPLFQEVWEFSKETIYPRTLAGRFNLETRDQLEDALRAGDKIPLADVLNPFLESLGVSHTRFYDRRHQAYYMLRSLFSTRDLETPKLYTIGVQLDDKKSGLIRAVMEGSVAAKRGLQREDRIVAVDGVPFESLAQWQQAEPISLTISGASGRKDVELSPVAQSFHQALAKATAASHRVFDCGDRRIGYIHLWSGTHEVFLRFLKDAVADAHAAELNGFILDLRDGYGGAWWPYLDAFFPTRETYFGSTALDAQGEGAELHADPQRNADAWHGPLAVIINNGTRSGKEALAFQFSKTDRAKLFGTNTSGAFTGGLGAFAERDVDYILFLAVQEQLLDGVAIEGVGVSPDVVVSEERGRDAPLTAALEHLACRVEKESHD